MKKTLPLMTALLILCLTASACSAPAANPSAAPAADQPTLPPLPIGTPTPEPTHTPVTPLTGTSAYWIVDLTQSNPELYLADSYETSNEQVAASRSNSDEYLQLLQTWGRVTGSVRWYVHQQGCGYTGGVREVLMQTVQYQTVDGAAAAFEYSRKEDETQSGYTLLSGADLPGSVAYRTDSHPVDACPNAGESASVRILFLRANAVGMVQVSAANGAQSADALNAAVQDIARQMDARMLGNY
ncbi:MAG: hypothetical protein ABFD44_05585 [Anaerolineaceae bacterium]